MLRQLAEHGELGGTKDIGLLESAMGRPLNKHSYGETDLCALAAAYAFGIARNHPLDSRLFGVIDLDQTASFPCGLPGAWRSRKWLRTPGQQKPLR